MARFAARHATQEDSAALAALLDECPMGSSIRLTMGRRPDFFSAARVQALHPLVVIGEEVSSGRVVATFAAGGRPVFVDGQPKVVRYLSDLRIHPDYRRSTLLARGFRHLRDHVFEAGEWAQTMVLEDNIDALELITSGRAGLPSYQPAGEYQCYLIPSGQRVQIAAGQLSVRSAERRDIDAMQAFYDREAPRKAFCPVYQFSELGSDYYRKLDIGDVSIATLGEEIVGIAACWDQSSFKQTRVHGYGGATRWLRPAYNLLAAVSPALVPLPNPGQCIHSSYATAIHCREDDPRIFAALLSHLVPAAKVQGSDFLVAGLDRASPLCTALAPWRKRVVCGRHYLVAFDTTPPPPPGSFYFECGRI